MRRIIILTGNGKGKTTSAIGSSIRALGRGFNVKFYQFLKSMDAEYGEHSYLKGNNDLQLIRLGHGCRKDFKYDEKDAKAAVDGLKRIVSELKSDSKLLVVLDEVSYPILYKWFSVEDVLAIIKNFPDTNFILTGRDMPKELINVADTVSSVEEIKHAYQQGCNAEQGIEF